MILSLVLEPLGDLGASVALVGASARKSVDQSFVKLYAARARTEALVNQLIAAGNAPPPDEPAR